MACRCVMEGMASAGAVSDRSGSHPGECGAGGPVSPGSRPTSFRLTGRARGGGRAARLTPRPAIRRDRDSGAGPTVRPASAGSAASASPGERVGREDRIVEDERLGLVEDDSRVEPLGPAVIHQIALAITEPEAQWTRPRPLSSFRPTSSSLRASADCPSF